MTKAKATEHNPEAKRLLHEAWKNRKLVPLVGAGLSIAHGLPSWNDLVLGIVLSESGGLR